MHMWSKYIIVSTYIITEVNFTINPDIAYNPKVVRFQEPIFLRCGLQTVWSAMKVQTSFWQFKVQITVHYRYLWYLINVKIQIIGI